MTAFPVHPVDLEPSQVATRTYLTRRRLTRVDASTAICVMLGLLMLIPSLLIVPGMTDVGRPGLVVALLLWFWWLVARLNPRLTQVGPQPIRWIVLAYLVVMLIGYAVGALRGLTTMESNAADRWMLLIASFTGVILIAADGIRNWERLNLVLRVFVWCSAVMAVIGLIQYALALDITKYFVIPGLQQKGWLPDLEVRGAGIRVASTTAHYIEFSSLMAMAVPFAIHFARYSHERGRRQMYAVAAILTAAAIPATVSRTGVVAIIIALACLFPLWDWRTRFNMLILGTGLGALALAVKPALVTTIVNLFLGASQDRSVTSRTDRYGMVNDYFVQTPWLGRGTGTWVSPQYQYLDNQWLETALANGIFGVVVLAALHITAFSLAFTALRRAVRPEDRHLCAALLATQLIALAVAATFDSLSFSTYATVMALMVGCCGTVWRFTHPKRTVRTSTTKNQA